MLKRERITVGQYMVDVRGSLTTSPTSLLLIHGIGVSGAYYVPFAEEMAKTHSVLVVDLPGYGKTPKPKRPLSILELADVVNKVVRYYKLANPVAVGHSMGCQVAARAVEKAPTLYSKMILLGPTVNRKERTVFMQGLRLLQDTFREPTAINAIIQRDYIRMGLRRYLQTSKYMVNDHIEKTLTTTSLPVLIIRGEKDNIVPLDWVRYLAKVTPKGEYKEIPGAPHVVQYKMLHELAKVCRDFLK